MRIFRPAVFYLTEKKNKNVSRSSLPVADSFPKTNNRWHSSGSMAKIVFRLLWYLLVYFSVYKLNSSAPPISSKHSVCSVANIHSAKQVMSRDLHFLYSECQNHQNHLYLNSYYNIEKIDLHVKPFCVYRP